jgi:hypothetical protein
LKSKENLPESDDLRRQLFNAKEIGGELREVAFDLIQSENGDVECRWFHGKNECDLYYWKDQKKNIIKQQVAFIGQIIEWNIIEGLRTGFIVDTEKDARMSGSPVIRFDKTPQMQVLEQGIEIVGHVASLNPEDKFRILENFIKSPLFREMTPEDIVERFGIQLPARTQLSLFQQFLIFLGMDKKSK